MKRFAAGMLVLLLACPLWGQTVKLPAEVKGEPGAFVKVPADTDGKEVRWYSPDKGLQVFPVELLKDSKTAVVTANATGRYRLIAWTAVKDVPSDPAVCVVVIGEVPPGPDPVPPTDPLTKALQSAFDKETDADKAKLKASLAALYRQAAELAAKGDVATWGGLFDVMRSAAQTLGVAGKLVTLQTAIAEELKAKLPTDRSQALDAAGRALAGEAFRRVAAALEGVK